MATIYWLQQQLGSGKTAVLVQRVVEKVIKEKIDIDKLLIVTFTNAAAGEMRERILEKLYEEIENNPDDKNMQKQIILLNKANISTIHSFCLDVIRNCFYEIDISPNFRLADTEEIELLKQEVIEGIFDNLYEEENKDFLKLINIYSGYISDDELKGMILKIFNFIQSTPFPEEWINEQTEKFNPNNATNIDFAETEWGKILVANFREEVESYINTLESILPKLAEDQALDKYRLIIENDINNYRRIIDKEYAWDEMYTLVSNMDFLTWPGDKRIE